MSSIVYFGVMVLVAAAFAWLPGIMRSRTATEWITGWLVLGWILVGVVIVSWVHALIGIVIAFAVVTAIRRLSRPS